MPNRAVLPKSDRFEASSSPLYNGPLHEEALELKKLIIVESPTKARTIAQFLGKDYVVLSSQGHVRDLPKSGLGVNIEKGFLPEFETKRTKEVAKLRAAAKGAGAVYLATDHDREGEAIAYDLYTILKRVVTDEEAFSRPVFNEITKPVILEALAHPSKIDLNKVEAQRTRRILDRLVGYMVSPLVSKTLAGNRFEGLSAGRVQSVALRFLCDREAEIVRFVPEEYWEIDARIRDGEAFIASLTRKGGDKLVVHTQSENDETVADLRRQTIRVESISEKERLRQPPPPFITSSLQQTASSVLGFSPKRTMKLAQELYEGVVLDEGGVGLITYMRTDSVRVSDAAVDSARRLIEDRFGRDYLSQGVRHYRNQKRSQDAHEAIRPTDLAHSPDAIASHLTTDQQKLYGLVYNRFLSTQMAPAAYRQRKALLSAGPYTLEAAGSTLTSAGFLVLFPEEKAEKDEVPAWLREEEVVVLEDVASHQKFTEPPRRYSEAGLVNLLEKQGIGRPSTYASIIGVIQERGYAVKDGGSLRPTLLGQVVVDFLRRYVSETVETEFTARMEEDLDRIEEGEMKRVDVLNRFYGPFAERLTALDAVIGNGKDRPFRVLTDLSCDKCGAPFELRYWKGSHFLGCSAYPACRNTRNVPPDARFRYDGDTLFVREALEKLESGGGAEETCQSCGGPMHLKDGRYGRYWRCTNPECGKTASVSSGVMCPVCGEGELVEKYSQKRRRTFYSCNRYPACRFATSERPVKACPACKGGILIDRQGTLVCTDKACAHSESPNKDGGSEGATPPRKAA